VFGGEFDQKLAVGVHHRSTEPTVLQRSEHGHFWIFPSCFNLIGLQHCDVISVVTEFMISCLQ
jgi:hypothetical protein